MTRESIPSFDLYAELEISRLASTEVIDAAYRTLAKRHHPDISRTIDADRIKRLNLAHDWLTDPVRRRRYDNATQASAKPSASIPPTASAADDDPFGPNRVSSTKAFGLNTAAVRQFLAELRTIDEARAAQIHAARSAADSMAYAVAQHTAFTAAHAHRESQWLLAREAASVIVRGKLHGSPREAVVAGAASDVAGAIAIRDLIAGSDFDVLLQPWIRREMHRPAAAPVVTGAAAAAATAQAAAAAAARAGGGAAERRVVPGARPAAAVGPVGVATPPRIRLARTGRSIVRTPVGLFALVAVIAVIGAGLVLGGPRPETAVAGVTDAPFASLPVFSGEQSAAPSDQSTPLPGESSSPAASEPPPTEGPTDVTGPARTLRPTLTPAPTQVPTSVPTAAPTAVPTAVPTLAPTPDPTPLVTPVPTPVPTPSPTLAPTPSPTLAPTPSPTAAMCTVANLFNVFTTNAQVAWNNAGFTGTVHITPSFPSQYWIRWQSLTAGTQVLCTSDITVRKSAP